MTYTIIMISIMCVLMILISIVKASTCLKTDEDQYNEDNAQMNYLKDKNK